MKPFSDLKLADLMTRAVTAVAADLPLVEAARVMARQQISSLLITRTGSAVGAGILTERDLGRLLAGGTPGTTPVGTVMSQPLHTVSVAMSFRDAYARLRQLGIRHLVVADDAGEPCGLVSETDLRNHLSMEVLQRLGDIDEILEREIRPLRPEDSLARAVAGMVTEKREFVLICRDHRPLGILTERDLPRLVAAGLDLGATPVSEVMHGPLITIRPHASIAEISHLMQERRVRHVAVVNADGSLRGVISQHRLLEWLSFEILEETLEEDLTLRRRQIALEQRLEFALEASNMGVWEYDHGADAMVWDQSLHRLFRHATPPTGMQAALALVHPEDQALVRAAFEQSALAGVFEVEFRIRHGDGRWLWVESRGRVIGRGETGEPLLTLGTVTEIGRRREQIQETKRLTGMLTALVDGTTDCVFAKDLDGRYSLANPAMTALFGRTAAEILGRDDFALVPQPLAERLRADDARVRDAGRTETYEELITTDAGTLPFLTTKGPLIIDGGIQGVFGIARDISDLQRTQRVVLKQQEIFESLAGYWDWWILRDESELSATFKRVIGYADQAPPKSPESWQRHVFPEDLPGLVQAIRSHIGTHGSAPFYTEVRLRHRGGGTLWTICTGSAIEWDTQGRATRIVGCHIDITRRKRFEAERDAQIDELRRWQAALMGREGRTLDLKGEVNALLAELGRPLRYPSAAPGALDLEDD